MKRTFAESLWTHYRYVPVGRPQAVSMYEHIPGYGQVYAGRGEEQDLRKEEHWGRRETCRKCRRGDLEMGDFNNIPTLRGFLVLAVGPFAAVVLVTWVLTSIMSANL